MAILNEAAKQARITAYKDKVKQKLASRIIDTDKPEFADLIANVPSIPVLAKQLTKLVGQDCKESAALEVLKALPEIAIDLLRLKTMTSLNGAILLERDLRDDGRLKGVVSGDVDDLASILPDIKTDTENKLGWKKWLDMFFAEGLPDILEGVADPTPDEYDPSAMEELAVLDIDTMSDAEAKQKLKDIKIKAAQLGDIRCH